MQLLRANSDQMEESLDSRLRAHEPIVQAKIAEQLEKMRKEMIQKIKRLQQSKEISSRREKEAFDYIVNYRKLVPRGGWAPLREELERELAVGQTDFYRKIKSKAGEGETNDSGKSQSSLERDNMRSTTRTTPKPPTRTDSLAFLFKETASKACDAVTNSERCDVFARRLLGQIASRYQSGKERSKSERVKMAQIILQGLGIAPDDLIDYGDSIVTTVDRK